MALVVKNLPANVGDLRDSGSIPGSGRSPGGGWGNPLWCSCLENPNDRGAWQATVHAVEESDSTEATQHACTCASFTSSEMIRQPLLTVIMISFDPDPMSHSPEVVENSFLFLCFTLSWVPRHGSVNFEIFTRPLIIKHFYFTYFCNYFLQVGNRLLPIECLVLSVLSILASLVKFVYFILTTTLSDRCLLLQFLEKKRDTERINNFL